MTPLPRKRAAVAPLLLLLLLPLLLSSALPFLALLSVAAEDTNITRPGTLAALVPVEKEFQMLLSGSRWSRVVYRMMESNTSYTTDSNLLTQRLNDMLTGALNPMTPSAAAPSPASGVAAVSLTSPPSVGSAGGLSVRFSVTRMFGVGAMSTLSDADLMDKLQNKGNTSSLQKMYNLYGASTASASSMVATTTVYSSNYQQPYLQSQEGKPLSVSAVSSIERATSTSADDDVVRILEVQAFTQNAPLCDSACIYSVGIAVPLILIAMLAAPIFVSITRDGKEGPNIVCLIVPETCESRGVPAVISPCEEPIYFALPGEEMRKTDNVHLDGLVVIPE